MDFIKILNNIGVLLGVNSKTFIVVLGCEI